jgi:uncharacterized paraquat-inducible protein A
LYVNHASSFFRVSETIFGVFVAWFFGGMLFMCAAGFVYLLNESAQVVFELDDDWMNRHLLIGLSLSYWGLLTLAGGSIGWRRADRHLKAQDPDVCSHCAYNLTANTSGVCPECGTPTPRTSQRI